MHFCALRGFLLCSQIRTGETVEMFTKLWYNMDSIKCERSEDMFELTNEQRKCFAIPLVLDSWKRVS